MQYTGKINTGKTRKVLIVSVILFSLVLMFIPLPSVKAQYPVLTIYADSSECASVLVSSDFGRSETFTSFPATFYLNYYQADYVTITVTAHPGYTYDYATSSSTSYLSNPFSNYFSYSEDIYIYFTSTTPEPTPTPEPSPTGYQYIINGAYDENNPSAYMGNVTVTAYYPNGSYGIGGKSTEQFTVAGSYTYNPPSKPMYFSYNLAKFYGQNVTRQYWLGYQEHSGTLYVYVPQVDITSIAFSLFNYKNIDAFDDGAILTARNIASLRTIDRRLVDSLGTVNLQLQPNMLYDVTVESVSTGDVYNLGKISTATSLVTLNIPASAFPSNIVNLYTYSYAWAYREFSTNSIMVRYEDTTNLTTQLELIISDPTDNTVYFQEIFTNETHNVNLFNYAWNYAVNASSYNVWVVVTSESKSTYYFKQYLLGMYDKASNPFDFGFMGSINGLDTAIFIPAFIIIAAAGCFNQMNAEIAAFLTTISAIVLAAIGWITISSSMLVVALSLSILAGIVTARRRFA